MRDIRTRLLIIGAGPGGYVCAIRAGQLGIDTIIVDGANPGGTCLNVGCIPSKALIHAADEFSKAKAFTATNPLGIETGEARIDLGRTMDWKDKIVQRLTVGVAGLMKRNGVRLIEGWAKVLDGKSVSVETPTGTQVIRAEHLVIASGSAPVELPSLPFGGKVISSTEALELRERPANMAVIGGGYIGLELGTAFAKLGTAVTVIEAEKNILGQYDDELTRPVFKRLQALGIEVLTETRARALDGDELVLEQPDGALRRLKADKVLVTVGRKPGTTGWGLSGLCLDMDDPFLRIDDTCRTSMRGVHAIGDVTGEPMLAHRAMAQGGMVAEIIAGERRSWDKVCIPAICFTDPEIVSAGLSPDQARRQGIGVKIGAFSLQANGRAMTMEAVNGMIRVVARRDNHLVLGLQAVGTAVSELSAGFALALEMGARLEDLAETIHAHPTQSEGVQEAALKALGAAIHG